MQVSIENVGKLERKLVVRLPADAYESTVRSRIADAGRNVRLKGFRPGKVPVRVIEQRFGAQIRGEAMSELVRTSFQQAVSEQKLRPAASPSISTSGEPVDGQIEYTATFEVLPEIGKLDVTGLAITKHTAVVADADVDAMIETLRQQRRAWTSVERAAQAGDMALFEFSAQGEGFAHERERVGTIIGSGAMGGDLENALIGHAAGDEFDTDVTFPADFRNAALAGKAANASIKLMRVQEAKLPDVDAAFIAGFGIRGGDIEKFRADVRANLERELTGMLAVRLKNEVVEKLIAAHPDIELPQGMVDAEARALHGQAQAQAQQQGQAFAADVSVYMEMARRRVCAGVLIGELARQNDIRPDSRRVAELLATIASTYEEPAQVVELYQRDPQLMGGLQNRVMEDQVAEWVAAHAQTTEQTMTFNEAMRQA
ncbi:MAG: trigger factor [Xanthomonadaceae bacterium]|nr:trigger factor [Xanthomonadaceae bacterium]